MLKVLLAALATTFLASIAIAAKPASPFKNIGEIAANLSFDSYAETTSAKPIKIAILDNGFRDYAAEVGKALPSNVQFHAGPIAVDPKTEEAHGLYMAEIVAGLLNRTKVTYELHLFSAFGFSNLSKAVETVTNDRFDIVLYSQVWEYGGNGDGRGFINSVVNKATSGGVVWINASGNFGDATYTAPVEVGTDDWAVLPSRDQGVRVRCLENPKKKCQLRAVLSWNDFKDQADIGTDKDLDLVLSDDTLKVIRTGGLEQVLATPVPDTGGTSLYPREIVEAELKPGVYILRAKVRSKNFSKDKDTLKIVTSGDYLEQLDTSDARETLLAPADNASVITVGATDSEKSGASDRLAKPEVGTASEVRLTNGDTFKGSSNSAAMMAALAVVAKAITPDADRSAVLAFLKARSSIGTPGPARGTPLTLDELEFQPTGSNCFRVAILPHVPAPAEKLLRAGAVSVKTSAGLKIMTASDPFTMGLGVNRQLANDMLVVSDGGYRVYSRGMQKLIRNGSYEVVQKPQDANYCEY